MAWRTHIHAVTDHGGHVELDGVAACIRRHRRTVQQRVGIGRETTTSLSVDAIHGVQGCRALGPAFDPRRFHNGILADAALPMDLLQQQVETWVAERKTSGR